MRFQETYSKKLYQQTLLHLSKTNQSQSLIESEKKIFKISLMYIGRVGEKSIEEFELHGIINAVAIFENYRQIGHNLNLRNIKVKDDQDKIIKKINFTYTDKRQLR